MHHRPDAADGAVDFEDEKIGAARRMRGNHLLGRRDGGFHAHDQCLHARMMGAPLGQTGFDGIAIARLRACPTQRARFGNIIVLTVFAHGRGYPLPGHAFTIVFADPRTPPHRFDQKRRGLRECERVVHAPSAVRLPSRGGKRPRRHQAQSETGIGNNYHDF
jgi:hypothetical protein